MKSIFRLYILLFLGVGRIISVAAADTFGSGGNAFDIDFVTVGNPGNPPDNPNPNPAGAVPYSYRIGKYEISEQMIDKANALGGLDITKDTRGPGKPATSVTWFDAASFANWLNTSTGNTPAYKFDNGGNFELWQPGDAGYDANNLFRNRLAKYFLPSADEWYKAAYYDPAAGAYWDYPTGSNLPPIAIVSGNAPGTAVYGLDILADGPADVMQAGGLSPFGTMAQGGNAEEWEETEIDRVNDDPSALRFSRGASWESLSFGLSTSAFAGRFPSIPLKVSGLRIASVVPEPSELAIIATTFLAVVLGMIAGLDRTWIGKW